VAKLGKTQNSADGRAVPLLLAFITEANRMQLVLFGTQNRTMDPILAAVYRILIPVMFGAKAPRCMHTCTWQWQEFGESGKEFGSVGLRWRRVTEH
jgi:hypothetical protein